MGSNILISFISHFHLFSFFLLLSYNFAEIISFGYNIFPTLNIISTQFVIIL